MFRRYLLFVCTLLASACPAAPAAELTANVARVDITPPLELQCPLGGYGERMSRPAEGVHDRLFAKALVLHSGDRRFALVTADALAFPPAIKPALLERLAVGGWTSEQLLLLPSHTHTSIEMNAINPANTFDVPQIGIYNPRVFDFVVDRLTQVVEAAQRDAVPVGVGTSQVPIDGWNRNRRGGAVIDNDLTVTRIDTQSGRPLAVLVNFAAHPTFMSSADMLFSGDWPGHLQRTLESLIGEGAIALYYNGAQGDQSPVARPESGPSRWERAEHYGRDLAVVAWRQWRETPVEADTPFDYHQQTIDLPDRTWHPDFRKTGGAEYGLTEELLREMLPRLFPARVESVSLRLGELVIVGIPGEMAAALGRQLRAVAAQKTGAAYSTVGGLADVWISYMLPAEEYRRGGYEASVSFYGETLGQTIVEGALESVKQLGR
jgi:hypothetical protein